MTLLLTLRIYHPYHNSLDVYISQMKGRVPGTLSGDDRRNIQRENETPPRPSLHHLLVYLQLLRYLLYTLSLSIENIFRL